MRAHEFLSLVRSQLFLHHLNMATGLDEEFTLVARNPTPLPFQEFSPVELIHESRPQPQL